MKVNVNPNLLQSTIKETNMTSIDSIMFVNKTYLLYINIYSFIIFFFKSSFILKQHENIRDEKRHYELLNLHKLNK